MAKTNSVKDGFIFSTLNYPVSAKYNGKVFMIPPKANKLPVADVSKLTEVPTGIKVIENASKEDNNG